MRNDYSEPDYQSAAAAAAAVSSTYLGIGTSLADPMLNRERFAVSLRKSKRKVLIN